MRCGLVWREDVDMFLCTAFFVPSKKFPSKKGSKPFSLLPLHSYCLLFIISL